MNTSAIYIKTDPKVKERAQMVAKELGFSLSSLLNAWLKQLIKTKTVTFSAYKEEIPNEYLRSAIKKAEENYRKGNTSPAFSNPKDAIKYLEDQGI